LRALQSAKTVNQSTTRASYHRLRPLT